MRPYSFPLFVPATRPDRYAKAAASGTDTVIVDLEDAVNADDKDDARNKASETLAGLDGADVWLRVNGRPRGTRQILPSPCRLASLASYCPRPSAPSSLLRYAVSYGLGRL